MQILCDEKDFKLEGDGTGFYIALDTLSEDESKKTKKLKALAKYTCDGTTSEEDITAQVEWKASDETQVKVSKGLVAAVAKNMTSESPPYVEAKYQKKNSNQAKVYINSCPKTTIASTETENKFSFSENSLIIPKVNAQVSGKSTFDNKGCASCGKNNTCHFSGGNPSAELIFVLVRSNDASAKNDLCKSSQSDWEKEDSDVIEPPDAALRAESEASQHLPYFDSKFAIYWSSEILNVGEKDENCPEAKFSSYGYIFKGTGGNAKAERGGSAKYCGDAIAEANVFAHEQIGHSFGHLDDEYTDPDKDYRDYDSDSFAYTLNCTPDKNCPKWKNKSLSQECIPGCYYSTTEFYRSSDLSIMKSDSSETFGIVNTFILKYWATQWPTGPWGEMGDLTSPTKEPIQIIY